MSPLWKLFSPSHPKKFIAQRPQKAQWHRRTTSRFAVASVRKFCIAALSTERPQIVHVTLIQRDVILRKIARIHDEALRPGVKINVEIKLRRRGDFRERVQSDICRTTTPECKGNLAFTRAAVANIDNRLLHFRRRIAERAQNSSPIGIAAAPAPFHERAGCDRPR